MPCCCREKDALMSKRVRTFVLPMASAIVLAATVSSHAVELQPGLWRDTETGTENGQPAPPATVTNCLTPEETKDLLKGFSPEKEVKALRGRCKTLDAKQTAVGFSMRVQCGDPTEFALDVTANYTFTGPQSYTATMKSIVTTMGAASVMDKKIEGRWVSANCKR
jgi:hypothetical protein